MQKYLLGIDQGNSKTEILLCTEDGDFVDMCNVQASKHANHESLLRWLSDVLQVFLERNDVKIKDISAIGIGITLAYKPQDKNRIEKLAQDIFGIEKVNVSTDTGHGTYAYWIEKGMGIYSFLGTGDIAVGLTKENKWLSVGGLKLPVGDEAGGDFLYKKAIAQLYNYHYRCGKNSVTFREMISMLGLDENDLNRSMKESLSTFKSKNADILKLLNEGALVGDRVAVGLFSAAGVSAGKSAAGCINKIGFEELGGADNPVSIVLIGSIWNKFVYDGMRNTFLKTVEKLTDKAIKLIIPEAPPVVGAVLKAKESVDDERVTEEFRQKVQEDTAYKWTALEIAALKNEGCSDVDLLYHLISVLRNKPKTAERLGVKAQISKVTAEYPTIRGVEIEFMTKYLPVVNAVIMDDSSRAFHYYATAYINTKIPQPEWRQIMNLFPKEMFEFTPSMTDDAKV